MRAEFHPENRIPIVHGFYCELFGVAIQRSLFLKCHIRSLSLFQIISVYPF